jgi:hypothetical protein
MELQEEIFHISFDIFHLSLGSGSSLSAREVAFSDEVGFAMTNEK